MFSALQFGLCGCFGCRKRKKKPDNDLKDKQPFTKSDDRVNDKQQDSSDEYTVELESFVDEETKLTLEDGPHSDVVLNSEENVYSGSSTLRQDFQQGGETAIPLKKERVKKVSFSRDIMESEYVVDQESTLGRPGDQDARPNAWFIEEHQDLNPGQEDIVNHSVKTCSCVVDGVKCRSHAHTHARTHARTLKNVSIMSVWHAPLGQFPFVFSFSVFWNSDLTKQTKQKYIFNELDSVVSTF